MAPQIMFKKSDYPASYGAFMVSSLKVKVDKHAKYLLITLSRFSPLINKECKSKMLLS